MDGTGCALTSLGVMQLDEIWDQKTAQSYDTPGSLLHAVVGPVNL